MTDSASTSPGENAGADSGADSDTESYADPTTFTPNQADPNSAQSFNSEWISQNGTVGSLERPTTTDDDPFAQAMEYHRQQREFQNLKDIVVTLTRLKLFAVRNVDAAMVRNTVARIVASTLDPDETNFVTQNTSLLVEQVVQEVLTSR